MIPFYAEELGNIHVLRATISVDSICDVARLLKVEKNVLTLDGELVADLNTVDMGISTKSLIVAQPTNVSTEEGKLIPWEVKLTLEKSPQPLVSQQAEVKEWWSSRLLMENSDSNRLCCSHCNQMIFHTDVECKIKDLPSEHWYELVECWICHETKPEEHSSRMKPILARPNVLLVGSTYFLIHTKNLSPGSIERNPIVEERVNWDRGTLTKWIAVNCSNCKNAIGEGQYCREGDKVVLLSVKLYKYSLNIEPSIRENPVFKDFLISDLVNTSKVHATHRFIIQGQESRNNYLLLWLFNWDTNIIHNNGYVDSSDHKLSRERTMKVIYLDCTDGDKNHIEKYTGLWSNDKSTDHLIYPDVFCAEILNNLKTSTLVLPPFMRKINHPAMILTQNFSVGFIQRHD